MEPRVLVWIWIQDGVCNYCRIHGLSYKGCRVLDIVDTQSFSATLLLPVPTSFLLFSVDFFSGFALTFSGNTYLIKICVLDFQSSINRLCVTFHIAIFSPYCCLYCLYKQSSAHISFTLRFAVIMDKLKHKDIICLQIKILCDNLTIFVVTM